MLPFAKGKQLDYYQYEKHLLASDSYKVPRFFIMSVSKISIWRKSFLKGEILQSDNAIKTIQNI